MISKRPRAVNRVAGMRNIFRAPIVALAVALSTPLSAQGYQAGKEAARRTYLSAHPL